MYNLLITSQVGLWDKNDCLFSRDRFLEFTNDKIKSSFYKLTDLNIKKIKSFPCIFSYEEEEGDVYIGWITELKERDKGLFIEYKIFKQIPFSKIKLIKNHLDIREWETSRTHWAIKDEDLFDILIKKDLIKESEIQYRKPDLNNQVQQLNEGQEVSNIQDFIIKVLNKERDAGLEYFYRGQDKAGLPLIPSLFRSTASVNTVEHFLYQEMLVSNSSEFSSDVYTLDRLIRMRHYSLPTRLLDITSNPLIALYFACKEINQDEGEVIIFSLDKTLIKYFDSDTASCIANLARLSNKEEINFELDSTDDFNDQSPIRRLIHFIKEEKSFFESKIIKEDLKKILCIKGKRNNDRILSQSGAFLLFGYDSKLDESGGDKIKVERIKIINKKELLKELDLLNINESTVFPDIESSAKYIASKFKS